MTESELASTPNCSDFELCEFYAKFRRGRIPFSVKSALEQGCAPENHDQTQFKVLLREMLNRGLVATDARADIREDVRSNGCWPDPMLKRQKKRRH